MQMLLNNRYRVISTLGNGGFGETFLAEDTQMPSNRRCVVKLLKPIQNNPQVYQLVQERFQREAAILEDLGGSTDQIPALYAYFQVDGQFYLVQEWIEGDTLTAKVQQQGALSESVVREILINLLPVLEYVHNKRIVHRDIKPDNIILRYRDHKPVLIDFGAVREAMGTMLTSQGHPASSIIIGTPGYMPSEQAAGRPMYSSDLYSLGITAIFLLTKRQPQELETDPRNGDLVWYRYAPGLSPTIRAVLDRAIAYHPRDRFSSAREMLEALLSGDFSATPTLAVGHYTQSPTINTQVTQKPQNTVPIGNTPSYQAPIRDNGTKGILLGIFLAAAVGAIGAIGFAAFNKPSPQQTPEPPQIQPRTSPIEPTTVPSEPQETQVPVRKKTRPKIQRTIEPSPTPIEPQEVTPTPTEVPTPEVTNSPPVLIPTPTPTPTSTPTPTPTLEVPTSTPIPSPTTRPPQVEKPSPTEFVENYYGNINNRDFDSSWNQLSPSFQSNRKIHPYGYNSYVGWWGGQVEQVEIDQVNLQKATSETATVDAQLKYVLKSGQVSPASVRLILVWNAADKKWAVTDAKRLRG